MSSHSLDDFADDDDGAANSPDAGDTGVSDAGDRDVNTLATYRWTPEAAARPQCGELAQGRWLDNGEYVCLDRKDW